ncbi:hypothetical protein J3D54_004627 [Pseudomonas sp. GGS8]|nr:hypothetical protein [Pseudomonas sp. GGS8]
MSLQYVQVCTKLVLSESSKTYSCTEQGWVQADLDLSSEAASWATGEQTNGMIGDALFICAIIFVYSQIKKAIET